MQTSTFHVEAVRNALRDLDIADLQIDLNDECLYVRGSTGCYRTKQLAGERAAAAAPGSCIVNELRVAQTSGDDERVERDVTAAVARVAPVAAEQLRLNVLDGVVYLHGSVASADEREAIERAAWDTRGVLHVASKLELASAAPADDEITAALNEYVRRAMNVPPGQVVVDYRSGIASLRGVVSSLAQGQAIEDLLRWHDRVIDVVNNLRVSAPAGPVMGRAS